MNVRLPAVNAIQAVVTVSSCGVKPDTSMVLRHLGTYLLLGFMGIRILDPLKIFPQIPTDKNHCRKLQKINKSPDKQLKLLTILRAIPCTLVECSVFDCTTCQVSGAKPVADC